MIPKELQDESLQSDIHSVLADIVSSREADVLDWLSFPLETLASKQSASILLSQFSWPMVSRFTASVERNMFHTMFATMFAS